MITEERKGELIADYEYYVNRYLDKQCVLEDVINNLTDDQDEKIFLHGTNSYFAVLLPVEESSSEECREEFPLEDWIEELAVLMKHVEGIKKNEAYRRFIDNATEFVGYYQIGMTPKMAFEKFWGGGK